MTRYHLAAVSDSTLFSGAERALEILLAALPPDVRITVVGVDPAVTQRLASARPRAEAVIAPPSVRILRQVFRHIAPDLVHMNLASTRSCRPASAACFSLGLPVVLVDHLPIPRLRLRGQLLQRLLTRLSAARVSVGVRSSRLMESIVGLPEGSVLTVHNGVPRPDVRPRHPTEDELRVAVLGRLVHQKGVDVLLHAMPDAPKVRLTIAGSGELEPDLRCLATKLGLDDRVEFVGWVDPASIFSRVDAIALPSRNEGLPLVLLEAMQVGLPVIATSVGSVAEAVQDGETGLLVPPEDPERLARALNELVASPERRRRLGTAARLRAQRHFSPAAMASGYDAVYSKVLLDRGSSTRGEVRH